jgi:hypothetical protein
VSDVPPVTVRLLSGQRWALPAPDWRDRFDPDEQQAELDRLDREREQAGSVYGGGED